MEKSTLGKRLKYIRNQRGLTAEKLAEQCDITTVYMLQLEGDKGLPSLPVFITLCNALSVSPSYLLQDQLEHNELDEMHEFTKLWKEASPAKQQMVLKMLRAALEE